MKHSISVKILADSINPLIEERLTTFQVTFPRIILAEFNTHRMFSRNSASSRAIPFNKMVKSVLENPFIPIAWQKDHKGMQGTEYFNDNEDASFNISANWLKARNKAVELATELHDKSVTKQLCNRLLEPFMYHTVIITSGILGLKNFFDLRCPQYASIDTNSIATYKSKKDWKLAHPGANVDLWGDLEWLACNRGQAEIHISLLAEMMWDIYNEHIPNTLAPGDWHIPFGDNILISGTNGLDQNTIDAVKIATARCARVSYTVVGEEGQVSDYQNDIKLCDKLILSKHLSPLEHCARTMTEQELNIYQHLDKFPDNRGWCLNYRGFIQFRALI